MFDTPEDGLYRLKHVVFFRQNAVAVTSTLHKAEYITYQPTSVHLSTTNIINSYTLPTNVGI
jgi:hypothetical protein